MKEIRLLALLFVAALFVQNAAATLLPYSSHYQGRSYFSSADATGFVDFAVYDTHRPLGDEWTGAGFAAPGAGQYVYAYQIFSDAGSAKPIGSFTIMGINDPPIEHNLIGINTINDQDPFPFQPWIAGKVEPSDWDFSATRATWKFFDLTGATLVAGGYSWFLIFSSDHDWTAGKYEMQPEGGFPITGNPEPCTLALLGLGSAMLFAKRKNSIK
ncbi:MAG: PEP-CTERM sorting domain-containing protein [Sedimentisphaerales bacterium]